MPESSVRCGQDEAERARAARTRAQAQPRGTIIDERERSNARRGARAGLWIGALALWAAGAAVVLFGLASRDAAGGPRASATASPDPSPRASALAQARPEIRIPAPVVRATAKPERPSDTPTPADTPTPVPTRTPSVEDLLPVLPRIDGSLKARLREIHARGLAAGMRPEAFAKVGDSITVSGYFLTDLGCGLEVLGGHPELAGVIAHYRAGALEPGPSWARCEGVHNSFTRRSVASRSGWIASQALRPYALPSPDPDAPPTEAPSPTPPPPDGADGAEGAAGEDAAPPPEGPIPAGCLEGETPLDCELRVVRPAVAVVMFGTNEAHGGVTLGAYRAGLDAVVTTLVDRGVIPIVTTIPHRTDSAWMAAAVNGYNGVAIEVAAARQVPVLNFWKALRERPDMQTWGMSWDGIHPNARAYGADFSEAGLRFGYNQRNLITLQALDKIWRIVLQDGPPEG